MKSMRYAVLAVLALLVAAAAGFAALHLGPRFASGAPDADTIRNKLTERLPQLGKIDEVSKTPMPGVYEVRIGSDLFYTDAEAGYVITGEMVDAKEQRNLTQERQQKLLAVPFEQLPLKDAFTIVRGNGKRRLAIFEDPNCPYCKHFEEELQKVNNVTVHMFLYPILGDDSTDKSRKLWCAKDRGAAWLDWMLRARPAADANCDTAAIERNVEFGRSHRVTGTPTMILADGSRVPGALNAQDVEKLLSEKPQ